MLHDIIFVIRGLRRHPVFTAMVVLTLGLGIGATIMVFSIAEAVLLRPLPYPDSDRLVDVMQHIVGGQRLTTSRLDIPVLQEETQLFEDVAARYYTLSDVALVVGDDTYAASMVQVSANYFSVLGVQAAQGRTFLPEDAVPSQMLDEEEAQWQPSIVITHGLWVNALGADERVVGGTVQAFGRPIRVVGVLPEGFHFLHERRARWVRGTSAQIFMVYPSSYFTTPGRRGGPGTRGLWPLARLRPGITYEEAQAGLDVLSARLRGEFSTYAQEGLSLQLLPLEEDLEAGSRPILMVLSAGVILLLVLICGNISSLLLVRGRVRTREDAVRIAVGGPMARLAGQRVLEALLLAITGGAIGIGVGWAAVRIFETLAPRTVPLLDQVDLSSPAVLVGVGVGILFCVGFGLIPALQLRRQTPARVLSSDSPGTLGGGRGRIPLMNALVIGELAITMVLLTGAGIMTRTLLALAQDELGYGPENVVTFSFMGFTGQYDTREARESFLMELGDRLEALSDVQVVARSSQLPLSGGGGNTIFGWDQESYDQSGHRAHLVVVTHDYFQALGSRLLAGRSFSESETTDSTDSVIVGEDLARLAWPGQNPLGKQVVYGSLPRVGRVVRVAETLLMRERGQSHFPTIFAPEGAYRPGLAGSLVLRVAPESQDLAPAIRQTLHSLDPGLIPYRFQYLSERVAMSRAPIRFVVVAMSAFAAIALIVAIVGLFGVISYAVQIRTAELGIRMALGAERARIMSMMLRQGALITGIGILAGIIGALLLGRFMESVVFGISPTDPVALVATAVVLGSISMLACCAPARGACRLDPAQVLRTE